MSKTVLVTGATGFVGSNLCEELIKRGYKVRALARNKNKLFMLDGIKAEIVWGTLSDPDALAAAAKGVDYIINVAGKASDWGSYDSFVVPNITGVQYLLDIAFKENIKRFVHISSVAIHGFGNHIDTTEDGPFFKTDFPYCITKHQGEELVLDYYKKHSLPVTTIRPANVYGERDLTTFLKMGSALEARQMPYIDHGKWLTCPVSVYNLDDAIITTMENDAAIGEAFLITDGLKITMREWIAHLTNALGVKEHYLSVPGWLARFLGVSMEAVYKLFRAKNRPPITRYITQQGSSNYHFSVEKAKRVLGWKPVMDLETAVEKTVRWYFDHKERTE